MMGQQGGNQERLFYSFSLEDHVPTDHLLRGVDRFLDLTELRQHLAGHYSNTGRPSITPELMIRMLVIGYCYDIRSERRLCEEVHLNLAYRWFCRLGLEDSIPDHSTFSKNRHGRFRESDTFRHVFESVLRRCMTEGLVEDEGFAIDASVVRADANRARGVPGVDAMQWKSGNGSTRAVREYVVALEAANPTETPPKSVSLTDPGARYTAAPGGPAFYAYSTNYLVDLKAGIIVDVEATPALRTDEVNSTRTMIDRVEERFDMKPTRLVGDTAYGAAEILGWMDGRRESDRAACTGVGQNATQRRHFVQQRVPVGPTGRRIPLPARQHFTQTTAPIPESADTRHQGPHHHLSVQSIGLRDLPDKVALLSEHTGSQDYSQRP
jgi:transposase